MCFEPGKLADKLNRYEVDLSKRLRRLPGDL